MALAVSRFTVLFFFFKDGFVLTIHNNAAQKSMKKTVRDETLATNTKFCNATENMHRCAWFTQLFS